MKGVAIPYLVAIIILIVIAAVVIFLIYMAIKQGGWDCTKCKTQFTTWCTECYLANVDKANWAGGNELGGELSECVDACGYWSGAGTNQDCMGAEDYCKGMIIY